MAYEEVKSFSMGHIRSAESSTSISSYDSELYFTRPKHVACKSGASGMPVMLESNYFEVSQSPDFKFTQYHVNFEPLLDDAKIRRSFVAKQKDVFGGYIFDGAASLFLTKELPEDLSFECISRENKNYVMVIKKTKNEISITSPKGMMLINLILRRAMGGLNLELIRRNYYDSKSKIALSDFKIELWPGYITSIRQHENAILLCSEISHKVLRQETALDVMERCRRESRANFKDDFIREIVGSIVMTKYNNKTYRVDDVDFSRKPTDKFELSSGEKTLLDYYLERYGIKIQDQNQPLLISNAKPRDIRAGRVNSICLVPELCCTTGLTDAMRNNFQLMRAMADYTRMDPLKRVEKLLNFNKRILTTPQSAESFSQFQTKLQPKLVKLEGRQLNQETILFGNNKSSQNDARVDWTNPMKFNAMFQNVTLTRWAIIYPARAESDTKQFLSYLEDVAKGMQYQMNPPKMIQITDDRVGTYARELDGFISKDPKFIMVVLPNSSANRYSAIKKLTCINNAIPTQVIVQKTMQAKKGNIGSVKSIATKVLIQINCKLGGVPWMINMQISGLMTIGFDVTHDTSDKRKSFGSFVASMDLKKAPKYYSAVASHSRGEEIPGNIAIHMKKALCEFIKNHDSLPSKIIFYRDGVGEGDIQYVHKYEVEKILQAIRDVYRTNNANEPKFAFIIVTKRINTRFFKPKGLSYENPSSGTVVDSVVTLPERYDFYLISQSVRQGTVSPTSYNVIADTLQLTPDKLQMLTYKLTHLYYNWSGTTRVPNVLQYAQKLGILVGQYLHQPPNEMLNNQLYFL